MKHRAATAAAGLFCCLLIGCASQKPTPTLAQRVDAILHQHDDGNVHFGARIVDLKTGRELYAHDVDAPLMPASNMKLPVSAAGLDHFGPDHVFKTYLAIDGDDLWLIGTGDPATGDSKIAATYKQTTLSILDRWADALAAKGISRIKGSFYYYDGVFERTQIHPSWSKSFAGDWYAAPVAGLNFNDNCVDISVKPTEEGKPVQFAVMPPIENIQVINNCTSGGKGDADVDRAAAAMVYKLKGAATKPTDLQSKAVTDPGAFFADALRTHLKSRGIEITGPAQRADKSLGGKLEPPADKIIAVSESKMTDIMWRIDKNSQNMFAEALCKLQGNGSWQAGGQAVRQFLKRHNIDDSHFVIVDGSGLSRENRVTVRLISGVLETMWKHPYHQTFFDSLSIAGKDGTLKGRMKDLSTEFHGKTGFIGGVRSLSGYVKTRGGEWLIVSMIFNGIEGSVKPVEEMQDQVVRLLAEYQNGPGREDRLKQPPW